MPFVQTHPNSPLLPLTIRQILHVLQGSLLLIEMAKFLPRETINHVFSLNGVQSSVKGRGVGMKQRFTSYITVDHVPTNSQSPFSSNMTGWWYRKDGIVIKIQSLLFQEILIHLKLRYYPMRIVVRYLHRSIQKQDLL